MTKTNLQKVVLEFVVFMGLVLFSFASRAADLTVNPAAASPSCTSTATPFCTIAQAMTAASDGDTIYIAGGTYYENLYTSKDLTFTALDQNNVPVLDGSGASDNIFEFYPATVTLSYIVLQNGTAPTSIEETGATVYYGYGGCISAPWDGDVHLMLDHVTIKSCVASSDGGGIYLRRGTLSIANSVVSGNTATRAGGGISSRASTVSIVGSVITGNTADSDGGIAVDKATVFSMSGTTISNNTKVGLSLQDVATANITRSLFYNNVDASSSGSSAAFEASASTVALTLTMSHSSFVSNSSPYTASAIYFGGSLDDSINAQLSFITAVGNTISGSTGGALSYFGNGTVSVFGSIFLQNTCGSRTIDCRGHITSLGYNILDPNSCTITETTGDMFEADPLLGAFSETDGVYPLAGGGPAVDAIPAEHALCAGTDQRGVSRPQGVGCDMGAYELEPVDQDSDGYTNSTDCNDTLSSIHPDAVDVCGDGIDQDCSGSDEGCTGESPVCGNAILESGEECDGGSNCDSACQIISTSAVACGNGTLESGEACDDGNTASGDGCDSVCQTEEAGSGSGNTNTGSGGGGGCSLNAQATAYSMNGMIGFVLALAALKLRKVRC